MINQEQVCIWFKELEGHSRIELMCALLDSCLPLELRFLGTYLEYGAGKHYTHLQRWEKDANNNNSISALTNLSDTKIRRRLCIFLALLHSHNRSVAMKLFDILNIYENFENNESFDKIETKFNWSDRTSRNEMKLLLTMAFLHPAFDFGQREMLRKKLQSFLNTCCVPEEKEKVDFKVQNMSQVSDENNVSHSQIQPQVTNTSFSKPTLVNSSMEQNVTKQPLVPLQLTPVLKYSIPLAHIPPQCSVLPPQPVQQGAQPMQQNAQPMQQILLQRQPVPLMHSNEFNTLYSMNTVTMNSDNQGPFQQNTVNTSLAHGVVTPRQIDMKNLVLHSMPVISSASSIDMIRMTSVIGESCNEHMWNRPFLPNSNVYLPQKNEIKTHLLTDGTYVSSSVECNSVFSNNTEQFTGRQNVTKLNGSIQDFHRGLVSQSSSANREIFRRSYSESDACEKSSQNAPTNKKYVNPHETEQSLRNNTAVQNTILPVYFPFSNHSKNVTTVLACHGLSSIPSPTFYSKPSMIKYTTNMYYGDDQNEIIPTGLNGGFIPQPAVVLSDSVNSHPTGSGVPPPLLMPERASNVLPQKVKHELQQHLTNYQQALKFHENLGSTQPQTLNISIHDNRDSICVSPVPAQSPRPSPYQSPGHSPMVPRKGYTDSKDNTLALSSAAHWLKSVRLHKYSSNFDGYTFQMMKDLNEEALEQLGLTVGARKKFRQCVEHLIKRGFKEFGETDTIYDDYSYNSSIIVSPITLQANTPPSIGSPVSEVHSPLDTLTNSLVESTYGGVDHPLLIVSHGNELVRNKSPMTVDKPIVDKKPADETKTNASRRKDQNATCYNCGAAGHYGDECTEQTMEAQTYSRYAFHLDFSTSVMLPTESTEKTSSLL